MRRNSNGTWVVDGAAIDSPIGSRMASAPVRGHASVRGSATQNQQSQWSAQTRRSLPLPLAPESSMSHRPSAMRRSSVGSPSAPAGWNASTAVRTVSSPSVATSRATKLAARRSRQQSTPKGSAHGATRASSSSPQVDIMNRTVHLHCGLSGTVRFFGQTDFDDSCEWVGIELDHPEGQNDGTVDGVRYFSCKPDHGMFVQPGQVKSMVSAGRVHTNRASVLGAMREIALDDVIIDGAAPDDEIVDPRWGFGGGIENRNHSRHSSVTAAGVGNEVNDGVWRGESSLDVGNFQVAGGTQDNSSVVALHNYDTQLPHELDLVRGDVLRVINRANDEWWYGERELRAGDTPQQQEEFTQKPQGYFPASYVGPWSGISPPPPQYSPPPPPPPGSQQYQQRSQQASRLSVSQVQQQMAEDARQQQHEEEEKEEEEEEKGRRWQQQQLHQIDVAHNPARGRMAEEVQVDGHKMSAAELIARGGGGAVRDQEAKLAVDATTNANANSEGVDKEEEDRKEHNDDVGADDDTDLAVAAKEAKGNSTQLRLAGWLYKKGGGSSVLGRRNWKKRFFRLERVQPDAKSASDVANSITKDANGSLNDEGHKADANHGTQDPGRFALVYYTAQKTGKTWKYARKGEFELSGCCVRRVSNIKRTGVFCFDVGMASEADIAIATIDVTVSAAEGRTERLTMRAGDDPEELARDFVRRHNLIERESDISQLRARIEAKLTSSSVGAAPAAPDKPADIDAADTAVAASRTLCLFSETQVERDQWCNAIEHAIAGQLLIDYTFDEGGVVAADCDAVKGGPQSERVKAMQMAKAALSEAERAATAARMESALQDDMRWSAQDAHAAAAAAEHAALSARQAKEQEQERSLQEQERRRDALRRMVEARRSGRLGTPVLRSSPQPQPHLRPQTHAQMSHGSTSRSSIGSPVGATPGIIPNSDTLLPRSPSSASRLSASPSPTKPPLPLQPPPGSISRTLAPLPTSSPPGVGTIKIKIVSQQISKAKVTCLPADGTASFAQLCADAQRKFADELGQAFVRASFEFQDDDGDIVDIDDDDSLNSAILGVVALHGADHALLCALRLVATFYF